MPQVLIISNRLPITVKKTDGKLVYEHSMGGVATGLSSYIKDRQNKWIGWPGIASDDLTEADKAEIRRELAKNNCLPVFMTQRHIDDFYAGYSNGLLWPLLHSMKMDEQKMHDRWWKAYREVNHIYADAIVANAKADATIWVHDYQLMLVSEFIARDLPHHSVGFFLHTPFPTFKVLNKLPEAKKLIKALLDADLVGLQTKLNVQNFKATVEAMGFGSVNGELLVMRGHTVRITDFPISIDYSKFDKAYKLPDVKKAVRQMSRQYSGLKIIAGVDRLDITKGFVERLVAYREFLVRNPKQLRKVVFVLVGAPSRSDVPAYQRLAKNVDKLVAEINAEFGTKNWQPVDYIKGLPFHKVTALFQIADVAFITPVRDGMNLVAKEYIASRRKSGVLILSETAGAAEELDNALLVNLKHPETLVQALEQALSMRRIDITGRFKAMNDHIAEHTIQSWSKDFMKALKQPIPLPVLPLSAGTQHRMLKEFLHAKKRAMFMDYDGVLSEIVADPDDAAPTKEVLHLLQNLNDNKSTDIYMLSGRSRRDMSRWLGTTGVGLVAEHGAYIREPHEKKWHSVGNGDDDWQEKLLPIFDFYARETPEAHVEVKSSGLVWHYRESPAFQSQKNLVLLRKELRPLLKRYDLSVHSGKKILEIKHKDTNKGRAVIHYLRKHQYDFILTAGDDYTDENMFKAVPGWAYSLKVGSGITTARFRVKSVKQLIKILRKFAS